MEEGGRVSRLDSPFRLFQQLSNDLMDQANRPNLPIASGASRSQDLINHLSMQRYQIQLDGFAVTLILDLNPGAPSRPGNAMHQNQDYFDSVSLLPLLRINTK
jgi:hypothetical protein